MATAVFSIPQAQFPPLHGEDHEGPDLNLAPVIEQALGELTNIANDPSDATRAEIAERYLDAWEGFAAAYGVNAGLMWQDVFPMLIVGQASDPQHEERTRRAELLWQNLVDAGFRFHLLKRLIVRNGGTGTNPRKDPWEVFRASTTAMRRFLATDGRILIDPQGNLTEGGGMPRNWGKGDTFDTEILEAGRQYFAAIACPVPADHIKDFTAKFGTRHDNGWIELTAQSPVFVDPEVAFTAWKDARRVIRSAPAGHECEHEYAVYDLAEDVIRSIASPTPRAAEIMLWIELEHDSEASFHDALVVEEDLAGLEAIEDIGPLATTFLRTIRTLRSVQGVAHA